MRWVLCIGALIVALVSTPAFAQQQIQYRYDVQGRLVRVFRPLFGTSGYITTYNYDDADNRRQKIVTFGSVATVALQPLGQGLVRLAEAPTEAVVGARLTSATPAPASLANLDGAQLPSTDLR